MALDSVSRILCLCHSETAAQALSGQVISSKGMFDDAPHPAGVAPVRIQQRGPVLLREEEAKRDGVDAQSFAVPSGQFDRHLAREVLDGGLGGRIGHDAAQDPERRHRRDVHDAARSPGRHHPAEDHGRQDRTVEVQPEGFVERARRNLEDAPVVIAGTFHIPARGVDQDVRGPPVIQELVASPAERLFVQHVRLLLRRVGRHPGDPRSLHRVDVRPPLVRSPAPLCELALDGIAHLGKVPERVLEVDLAQHFVRKADAGDVVAAVARRTAGGADLRRMKEVLVEGLQKPPVRRPEVVDRAARVAVGAEEDPVLVLEEERPPETGRAAQILNRRRRLEVGVGIGVQERREPPRVVVQHRHVAEHETRPGMLREHVLTGVLDHLPRRA